MPTQVTGSYADIYDWENLYLSYRRAAQGKRSRRTVAQFEFRLEDNLIKLQDELASETYQPSEYVHFTIHEPKKRLISAAHFRDRVVHHALCRIIEPAFERSFIHHSYANRVRKGTHRALDQCQDWLRSYRYVLQCDIRQFFPSIDHFLLLDMLKRRIQDLKIRKLIRAILASGVGILNNEYEMVYFADDDLFAVNRARGLPIGNLTSQFWANCYMSEFDHFINRALGCVAYLRYVDDFLLFANDKATLHRWRAIIIERLATLRLTLHENKAQVRPVSEGVGFLGFFLTPSQRRLLPRKGLHFRRTLRTLLAGYQRTPAQRWQIQTLVQSWVNHVHYGDTWGLRTAILEEVVL